MSRKRMESFQRCIHLAQSLKAWQCEDEYICGSQTSRSPQLRVRELIWEALCPGKQRADRHTKEPSSGQQVSSAAQPCTWPVPLLLVCWLHGVHSLSSVLVPPQLGPACFPSSLPPASSLLASLPGTVFSANCSLDHWPLWLSLRGHSCKQPVRHCRLTLICLSASGPEMH